MIGHKFFWYTDDSTCIVRNIHLTNDETQPWVTAMGPLKPKKSCSSQGPTETTQQDERKPAIKIASQNNKATFHTMSETTGIRNDQIQNLSVLL